MSIESTYHPKQIFPLRKSVQEQKAYGEALQVQPLGEVFNSFKARTGIDLLALYKSKYDGKAEKELKNERLSKYFDGSNKNRQYYQCQSHNNNFLIMEEDHISGNPDLCAVAVFDSSGEENVVRFKEAGQVVKETHYLYMTRYYLINKINNIAVELSSPWWNLPVDKGSKTRRIGLLPRDTKTTQSNMQEAIAKTNTILVTDTQSDDSFWNISLTIGLETTPVLQKWIAYSLAGGESTQKEDDIAFEPEILDKLLKIKPPRFMKPFLLQSVARFYANPYLRSVVRSFKKEDYQPGVADKAGLIASTGSIYFIKEDIERMAILALIRLKQNSLAASYGLILTLRRMGFDLLPNQTDKDLVKNRRSALIFYDELFYGRLQKLGLQSTFA